MSGEDNNTNNISAMDQVMAMLNTMNNNINESKKESNDKFESLKTDNIINNQSINEKFEFRTGLSPCRQRTQRLERS